MALVNKIDSNFTELRYALEQTPGVLPTTPTWIQAEPNEYKDFGGTVTTKARNPINSSRQRKKGVVVDIDANAGFTQDVTATNSQDFMSSFLFAAIREKTNADVAVVNTNRYAVASSAGFEQGDLLFAEDLTLNTNNGLKKVASGVDATHVPVTTTLTDATGETGTITRVGVEFESGLASINATVDEFPQLVLANVAASGVLTLSGNAVADETVTVGTHVYTWKASVTTTADQVKIGATASDSIDNLIAAINGAAGGGTVYGSLTVANASITAAAGAGDTMNATAKVKGRIGNTVATTETMTAGAWGSATLTSGAGRALDTLGLVPGSDYVFLGSEVTDTSFATAEDNGFCKVRAVTSETLTFDKTQFIMVDDAGTSKTIRLFLGHVLKNELGALIVKRSLQMERSLGAPDDAQPTQIQAQYVTRCLANEAKLDGKTADILKLEAAFMGGTEEFRTGAQGLKTGNRPTLVDSDAFNTTSDVTLMKMAVVTDGDSCPIPLFAYLTNLTVGIKNNNKPNKALSVLGSFDITAGTFEVTADVTAYFQTVESIALVQANASVTLEAHFVKENKGVSFDLPLITLAKAMADVKQDEAVMLPLTSDAATAKQIDPSLDYTLMWVYWTYLPNTAE